MKAGWQVRPLEDVASFSNGLWTGKKGPLVPAKVIRNTNFRPNGAMSFEDVAEIEVESKQLEKRQLRFGDIVLEKSGGGPKQAVGRVIRFEIEGEDYSFSNFTSAIRVIRADQLDYRYLHHVLNWWYASGVTEKIQSNSTGIRNLDLKAYKALPIPVPPLDEQKKIVAILDEAFEGLDRASVNAATNLADARELFNSTLETELSACGGIKTTLGHHVNQMVGFAFKSAEFTSDTTGIRLMRGDNIVPGSTRWLDAKYWPSDRLKGFEKYLLQPKDVLIAMDRTWIKSGVKFAVLSDEDTPSLLVQRVSRLRPKTGLLVEFLAALIESRAFEKYVLSIQTGTGVPHISGGQISAFPVTIPPLSNQEKIVELLSDMKIGSLETINHYKHKLNGLEALRQSLLQKAFSGELT